MTPAREPVPAWVLFGVLIALGANTLASAMVRVTVELMRSLTPFAEEVHRYDLSMLPAYRVVAYSGATLAIAWYIWPVLRHFRGDAAAPASALVQRRTVNAPLMVAAIGFIPWLIGPLFFPAMTLLHFGRWSPELASQQIVSGLVSGFLAATSTYLLLDWLFRTTVVPRVFPTGQLTEVPGSVAPGVRTRLLIFLLAVAFTPLFTVLGLIRAAAARVGLGADLTTVITDLTHASQVTFTVYVALGIAFTLVLARTLTQPRGAAAAAQRQIQRGALSARVRLASSDEIGVVEEGVNAMAAALQDRERILHTFGRIVEPAVRDYLLKGELRLGGEVRHATVMFCDLRGFTALSERLAPTAVVALLNDFFSAMADWVRSEGGFVDKFMGDGMLIVFGLFAAPDPAAQQQSAAAALRCALGMPARLAALNAARSTTGAPLLAVSIGLASGEVVAGTIGAEDRLEFTVIGDTVNVAVRLQDEAKLRGCQLLASATTIELAHAAGLPSGLAALAPAQLRGRAEAVPVFGA